MIALTRFGGGGVRKEVLALFAAGIWALGLLPPAGWAQDPPTPPIEQLEKRVQSIFAESCARAGCHAGPAPQRDMNLSPAQFRESIVGEPSTERPDLMRVHPGKPDSSYLVHKIENRSSITGAQMPLVGSLSEEEISAIKEWIRRLDETDETQSTSTKAAVRYPFDGWRLLNLPTTRALDRGSSLFLISHRFNPTVNQGYDALFGLDGSSIIYLGFGHALTDDLLLTLGRSNASDDVELGTHYQVAQQGGERQWPLGLSVHGALNWISEAPPAGERRVRGDAFKFTGQVSFARAIGDRFGVLVVPGVLVNPSVDTDGEDVLLTLGVGGRATLYRNVSVFAEWVPILSGYVRTRTFGNFNRFDSWGGGVEISTGGHVFQIVVSNSVGVATDQYLRGGDLDVRNFFEGDFRLGFNIFRVLNF